MLFFIINIISSLFFYLITIIGFAIAFIKNRKKDVANKWIIIASTSSAIIGFISIFNINVPCPTIYPLDNESKLYSDDVEITIDSWDFFKTYYSLNGDDPKFSKLYENNFIISDSTTVCARNKFLFWWSDISQRCYNFKIENETPVQKTTFENRQNVEIDNSTTIINNQFSEFSEYSEIELLRIAQTRYQNKDYLGCMEIYQLDKMQNNATAMCNLGYLYVNYYNYYNKDNIEDYDNIINIYNKADILQGYRNKLAFYIKYRNEVFYEDENPKVAYEDINELVKLLIDEYDDSVTKLYIVKCGKEKGKIYNYENFEYDYDFSIFYCYEFTDQFYHGSNPPDDTLSSFWRLKSLDPVEGHITATWQLSKYKYINDLEKFLTIDD